MDSLLAIDIGGGTQDVLLFQKGQPIENCIKLVLPTPTVVVAKKIRKATAQGKGIFLTGYIMGGGPCVKAIKEHLSLGLPVVAEAEAAKTVNDNLDIVKAMGIKVLTGDESQVLDNPDFITIRMGDMDLPTLAKALEPYEVQLPKVVAVAVQDHGEALNKSNRLFRFELWEQFLAGGGNITDLIYQDAPRHFTRMRAIQKQIPGAYVTDTGSAAIWGALFDPVVAKWKDEGIVIVNVGNNHTLGILLYQERVLGLFEHHTKVITAEDLNNYVRKLQQGEINFQEVYDSQGHGAAVHQDYIKIRNEVSHKLGKDAFSFISVTGPNRYLAEGLQGYQATPGGDMMLAGSFGLVEAVQKRHLASLQNQSSSST